MPWICPCGNTNSSRSPVCLACRRQITPPDTPRKKRGRLIALSLFGLVVFLLLALAGLNTPNAGQSITANPAPPTASVPAPTSPKSWATADTAAQPALTPAERQGSNQRQPEDTGDTQRTQGAVPNTAGVNPREQHLAELRKKREALQGSFYIESEIGKKLARDALKLSKEPLPDPDERRYLMEKMDEEKQRTALLVEEMKLIDAEIAKEEQQPAHGQTPADNLPATPQGQPQETTTSHEPAPIATAREGVVPPALTGRSAPMASQVLDQWVSTAKSCDVAAHSSLYDDTVASFYTKENLTKDDVANEIRNMCKTYSAFPALNLSAISWLPLSPGLVQVQFDKEFRAAKTGGGAYEGKVHSEITLRQTGVGWRIVGERDAKVYWTKQTP